MRFHIHIFIPDDNRRAPQWVQTILERAAEEAPWRTKGTLVHRDGRLLAVWKYIPKHVEQAERYKDENMG